MSYIVTARKWRPQKFEEVVGQQHISTTLKNAINNDRIAHAYIFAGPRGVGKTTTARILAKTLNCPNKTNGEPCNNCEMCNSFNSSQSMDIIEIDGASNRRIEEIRTLRESVKYAPTKGQYKIYIIDEVHMLTTESFNALLKTLEEPPEHTVFIFATTDIHKVPLTIISRCQRFDFRRIELTLIKGLLSKIANAEGIKIDDESLTIIGKKADGALRDAQSLFDQVISFCGDNVEASILKKMLNLIDEEVYFEIADAILSKDFGKAFEVTGKLYDNGWSFIDFLNGLVEHFRNILTVILRKGSDLIETAELYKTRYLDYEGKFSEGDLLRILTFLNKIQYEIRSSQNQKLKIEISLTQLIGIERSSTLTSLLKRIEEGDFSVSNTSSVQKDVVAEKKTPFINTVEQISQKKTVLPTFEEISDKWEDFINFVHSDKFNIAAILKLTKLDSLDGAFVCLSATDEQDCKILTQNKAFVNLKLSEFFNFELSLKLFTSNGSSINDSKSVSENNLEEFVESNSEEIEPPLANFIKSELGGKEIKR